MVLVPAISYLDRKKSERNPMIGYFGRLWPARQVDRHSLLRNYLKFGCGSRSVDADQHLTIGIFRHGVITTAATDDDFSEKNADFGLNAVVVPSDVYHGDRNIAVIDKSAPAGAVFKRQCACRQILEFVLQCFFEQAGSGFPQGIEKFGYRSCR